VGMKLAILYLGLWLARAQGFADQACCSQMPISKTACDGCGRPAKGESSRPDCCTSLEAQKDVDLVVARNSLPEMPVVIELLAIDPAFASWRPESTHLVAQQVVLQAEGPPLYLRNSVLLI